ncbi:MAG: hypothetical protein ACQESP_12800, partial [Candidatus Muiribacteriota bacterium]
GYIVAAFINDFNIDGMKRRISDFVINYTKSYGEKPSRRAIYLNLANKNLPEFTEGEILKLMPNLPEIAPKIVKPIAKKETKIKSDTDLLKEKLLQQYKKSISKRGDLKKLSEAQQSQIKTVFISLSVFLKELKDIQQ